jgi:lysophospholipase L1-like esterase
LLLYQALIFAGGLLALEALARIAFTVQRDLEAPATWYRISRDVGWEHRPGFSGYDDCDKLRSFDAHGLVASDASRLDNASDSRFRVVFVGDSNTYGYCLEAKDTFAEAAAKLVPGLAPINLAVTGYTSYQGMKTLERLGPGLDPHMIVVSFNFNDRRMVLDNGQADGPALFARLKSADTIQWLTGKSYLLGMLMNPNAGFQQAPTVSSGTVESVRLDRVRPRVDARSYRENLVAMAEWAKSRGIPVAFILLGDNWDDSYFLREGMRKLAEKAYEAAIADFTRAKDDPDDGVRWFSAVARIELAKALREVGQAERAEQVLTYRDAMVSGHGGVPVVADTVYHAIMRDVARQYGAPVIDAVQELSAREELYMDFCHFDARGHEIVGRLIAEVVAAEMKRRRKPSK